MLTAWVAFPLALGAVGLGWGLLVRGLAAAAIDDVLLVPLGLAAAIVAAGLITSWTALAPATTALVAAGAALGLALAWRRRRHDGRPAAGRPPREGVRWAAIAAVAVLVAYGAPVLLSGGATFAGYVRLDDTATWLGIIDRVVSHGRSLAGLAPSTYQLNLNTYLVGGGYPTGAFLLPGVGRALVGGDAAWIFQPYLACCAAALSLGVNALVRPLAQPPRLRALVAFVAAQPALLYGYSLWGGVKELTAAFELVLLAALLAPMIGSRPQRLRGLLPPAVAGAAVMVTLGPGGAVWAVPAMGLVAISWLWASRRSAAIRGALSALLLAVLTAALALPVLLVLASFLGTDSALFASGGGASSAVALGNLLHPLSVFQLAGIWPVGDFRYAPSRFPTALFIWLVAVSAAGGIWWAVSRRRFELPLYLGVAGAGCAATALAGGSPWVIGKSLAIASPALLACGLAFTAWLSRSSSRAWMLAFVAIAAGVLWSNVLAYHDVLLAPRARLAELSRINGLVAPAGPTLINEYEIYGDRHFLRDGAPQEPAEYRPSLIPLSDGTLLTKSAWSDLDSFGTQTLLAFRSIVVRRSPAESRPPSVYSLRWSGTYYQLWQRPAAPATHVVVHEPLGDSVADPYCGQATGGASRARCSVQPVAVPACARVASLAAVAARVGGSLVAAPRQPSAVVRATQGQLPPGWTSDLAAGSVTPAAAGTLHLSIAVPGTQRYLLWLGGSFARGFTVAVDGRPVGRVSEQLAMIGQWAEAGAVALGAGSHDVAVTFPDAGLAPGSGDRRMTVLDGVALQPASAAASPLVTVAPARASLLCGRSLDWIEVVAPAAR